MAHNALTHINQVLFVVKNVFSLGQLALALGKDNIWPVDHNFTVGTIPDERIDCSKAQQIVQQANA